MFANRNNYLSFEIPYQIKQNIKQIQDLVKSIDVDFKPVDQETLHITLVFFGRSLRNLNKEDFKTFLEKVEKVIKTEQWNIELNKGILTSFPPRKNNLLVINYLSNKDGVSFRSILNEELKDYVNSKEPFWIPHITIGKLRSSNEDIDVIKQLDQSKIKSLIEDFKINTIKLSGSRINNHWYTDWNLK